MNFPEYYKQREILLKRVCYRNYRCKQGKRMILVNIRTHTTVFLEDLSADFFEILAKADTNEIGRFLSENELSLAEAEEFIRDLCENGILGGQSFQNPKHFGESGPTNDERKALLEFQEELYENGFLFHVHIDITNRCNLRCLHCYHPFEEYAHQTEVTLESLKTFIDEIYELGAFSITLSGGEALLRKDFWEIVKYISKKGMLLSFFTNGISIQEEDIIRIRQSCVQKIGVSLYAIEETIHDKITQLPGSCIKTKRALEALKQTDVLIEVKCVLMKDNFSQYKEMAAYCQENGFSFLLDTSMSPKLNGDTNPLNLAPSYEQFVEFSLDESFWGFVKEKKPMDWKREPCSAGRYSLYIDPLGNVYPCVSLRLKLGTMKEIGAIWKDSEELKKWQQITRKDFRGCGEEESCEFCMEICAGICLLENGNFLDGKTSACRKAQARQEAYRRLSKRNNLL